MRFPRQTVNSRPTFGLVNELTTGEQFLQAIDEENKEVTVIVHLYDDVSVVKVCVQTGYSNNPTVGQL